MKRLFAAAAMAILFMAAPAAAQQYPPAVNSLTVSDTTPTPGQTISIEGRTFAQGATVTVTLASDPVVIGSAAADASGVVSLQAAIPAATPLGQHTITAAGQAPDGSELSVSVSITVVAADGAADPDGAGGAGGASSLPRTGDDASIPLAKVGLALAAIGGVVTAVAAKRRKASAAPA
ncbi:MAG: LPXTG cell wall anchor domain-containing protein [Acidimicrobiales bacterium]|nr:LPXTG cell wall anchor domain-containing protein [Acidimicrobiales bacterium]